MGKGFHGPFLIVGISLCCLPLGCFFFVKSHLFPEEIYQCHPGTMVEIRFLSGVNSVKTINSNFTINWVQGRYVVASVQIFNFLSQEADRIAGYKNGACILCVALPLQFDLNLEWRPALYFPAGPVEYFRNIIWHRKQTGFWIIKASGVLPNGWYLNPF